jgi:hypothetical protein
MAGVLRKRAHQPSGGIKQQNRTSHLELNIIIQRILLNHREGSKVEDELREKLKEGC